MCSVGKPDSVVAQDVRGRGVVVERKLEVGQYMCVGGLDDLVNYQSGNWKGNPRTYFVSS
jgi:hypothetical protein